MADVFVSYVEEDSGLSAWLAAGLQAAGYTAWRYEDHQVPGPSHADAISNALAGCRAVIVLISPDSIGAPRVDSEAAAAADAHKPLVPLLHRMAQQEFAERRPRGWDVIFAQKMTLRVDSLDDTVMSRICDGLSAIGALPASLRQPAPAAIVGGAAAHGTLAADPSRAHGMPPAASSAPAAIGPEPTGTPEAADTGNDHAVVRARTPPSRPAAPRQSIPLIVATAGHRRVVDGEAGELAAAVKSAMQHVKACHPHTDLLLLSPLAEGADHIVARISVELGCRLMVPLPVPADVWRAQMSTDAAREQFDLLRQSAERVFVLPPASGGAAAPAAGSAIDPIARLAAYLADRAQIVISLWDGNESADTAKMVARQLRGSAATGRSELDIMVTVNAGPVYHVLVDPNAGGHGAVRVLLPHGQAPHGGAGVANHARTRDWPARLRAWRAIWKGGGMHARTREAGKPAGPSGHVLGAAYQERRIDELEAGYHEPCSRLDAFNADWQRLGPGLATDLATNKGYVLTDEQQANLPQPVRFLLEWYGRADTLAIHYQSRIQGLPIRNGIWRVGALTVLFLAVFLGVTAFEVYAHLWRQPGVLVAYPVLLAAAASIYRLAHDREWDKRYLDYRALAEGLRVQLFWCLAGIDAWVADSYLAVHQSEMDWIRIALQSLQVQVEHGSGAGCTADALKTVLDRWVTDQRRFFVGGYKSLLDPEAAPLKVGKDRLNEVFAERCHMAVKALALVSGGLALGLASLLALAPWIKPPSREATDWMIATIAVALAAAALIHGFSQQRAYLVHANRYQWIGRLFERAERRLNDLLVQPDLPQACILLHELGMEALTENAGWLILYRERPLNIPMG